MSFRSLSAILFDFGGTLDADGWHWLDRFYAIYPEIGLASVNKEAIKEAFYWADAQADLDPAMKTSTFRDMMERHVRWQFEKLGLIDVKKEAAAAAAFTRPAERILHRNFKILETLKHQGLKLGIVSNFYGNVETLCREFRYNSVTDVVADSAIVGLKKPDPAFYQWALKKLDVPAERTAFVGDSFDRDIAPAKALGMTTFWLVGDHPRACPDKSLVDVVLNSLEDLPAHFSGERAPHRPGCAAESKMKQGGMIAAGWGERLGQKRPKALTPVGSRALIDFPLDGFTAAGIDRVTCIVNEAAREVPEYVAQENRPLTMDWIIRTTPSSMHSFLIVLERLAAFGPGPFLITTVDSVCPPAVYSYFVRQAALYPEADVILGLTDFIDDENPLRVAMKGNEGTGLLPARAEDNPSAFEIVAMTNNGFDSNYVTAGFYIVRPTILKEKAAALEGGFSALRQYLGYLLRYGYRTYGVVLPKIVDVDRPEDIRSAEQLLVK